MGGGQDAYYQDDLAMDDQVYNNNNNNEQDNAADGQQYDDQYYNNNANGSSSSSSTCKVYDKSDFFTIAVQLMLAFMALASLYWKRLHERPRRTFRTWFLDVSKQGFGACYAHVMNMVRLRYSRIQSL
jgi:hypothetical protein